MSKTVLDEVAEVIRQHIPENLIHNGEEEVMEWARLILRADIDDSGAFGVSHDAQALEELLRSVQATRRILESLKYSTATFVPRDYAVEHLLQRAKGEEPVNRVLLAREALEELENWVISLRKSKNFRTQASKKRNWRAASVVGTCRIVWGIATWRKDPERVARREAAVIRFDNDPARNLTIQEYARWIEDSAPKSEREPPGPFGRFCEAVFERIGILSDDAMPVSAASALRSWRMASLQKTQN